MCGEQISATLPSMVRKGSPPRVRGTAILAESKRQNEGITPACAGNRHSPHQPVRLRQDHPRVCGEQSLLSCSRPCVAGSPPRVRGTAAGGFLVAGRFGITPACAGNSCRRQARATPPWDHPRVCGEQPPPGSSPSTGWGSPPRVRGTEPVDYVSALAGRITPACAGNRRIPRRQPPGSRDHPRVCGEQTRIRTITIFQRGSPPRVRGTDIEQSVLRGGERITPACAGNSTRPRYTAPRAPDHPRVCGEQIAPMVTPCQHAGSPPRVRGTGLTGGETVYAQRITPACAGNRKNQPSAYTSERDHPRVCGEQWVLNHARLPVSGSPPRVRGTASISL